MKITISSAVNKELILAELQIIKMQVFSGFACCTTCDRIPGGNFLSLHSVTLLQCYSVTQWQLGFLSRRPSRDKSGDRWETRRTSSQPQHRQDDQGSGENIVFFFPFLSLLRPCILCLSDYIYTCLLLNTFPSALLFICLLSSHSL